MRILIFTLVFFMVNPLLKAQTTFTQNGPAEPKQEYTAYTHATVYVNPTTVIKNATIIVKQGIIESVIENGSIPVNAIEINSTGKTFYASFIDLFSNYGFTAPS